MQDVRKTHISHILPPAQRMREVCVWIQLHLELRRPALAPQPREDALKDAVPSKQGSGTTGFFPQGDRVLHDGLRLSGGPLISFVAFSNSIAESFVASIASSRFSLYVSRSTPFAARP